jgi:hypothetical protein
MSRSFLLANQSCQSSEGMDWFLGRTFAVGIRDLAKRSASTFSCPHGSSALKSLWSSFFSRARPRQPPRRINKILLEQHSVKTQISCSLLRNQISAPTKFHPPVTNSLLNLVDNHQKTSIAATSSFASHFLQQKISCRALSRPARAPHLYPHVKEQMS